MIKKKKELFILLSIFIIGILLRFSVLFTAHHGDLNNNISWGQKVNEIGTKNYYEHTDPAEWKYSVPNQPPLSILTFAVMMKAEEIIRKSVWNWNLNYVYFPSQLIWFWDEKGLDLMIKLPSLIADVLIGAFIYIYLKKKFNVFGKALIITAIWLFNPISWYNSSLWGQTDSIVNLLGLLSIYLLLNKKLEQAVIFITLSFLFKASLAIFLPVLFYVALRQKYTYKLWMLSILSSLFVVFLISIWFHPAIDLPLWILNLYKNRILPGEIGYLTAGAFNFWWLIEPGKVLDSVSYLGLSARILGIIATLFLIILFIYKRLKYSITDNRVWSALLFSALVAFLFMTRIHPRYLYPFFPAATIYLAFVPGFWLIYILTSVFHFLNIYYLFWIPPQPYLEKLFLNPLFPNLLSILSIIIFILTLLNITDIKKRRKLLFRS